MLTLAIPIQIGAQEYTALIGGIRGSWNLQTRSLEVQIGPAREKDGFLYLGTREIDGEHTKILAPPILSTLSIQDSLPPSAALEQVFVKLEELIQAIEVVVVNDATLQAQMYQAGEEEMSLACTFTATSPGITKLEEKIAA